MRDGVKDFDAIFMSKSYDHEPIAHITTKVAVISSLTLRFDIYNRLM